MAALVVAAASACVPPPPLPRTPASVCGAPSFSCALPFPSERWQIADPTTTTGVRLRMPAGTFAPEVLAQFGPRDEISEALTGADGFSPMTPIVFQLPDALSDDSVPTDDDRIVVLVDATTGERLPARAQVSLLGADERGARNIVLVTPRVRLSPGHRVFAALRRGVRAADGLPAVASPSLASASAATRADAARLLPSVPWSDYLSVTSFTVRTDASISDHVDRLAVIVRSKDHPIRDVAVSPSIVPDAVTVSGQVLLTDFRDGDGVVPRDGSVVPRDLWVPFLAVVPQRGALATGAPVMLYAHGLTVFKESMPIVAIENARKGIATVGIDYPNHGDRTNEGGFVTDLFHAGLLGRLESMMVQGEMDTLSLVMSVTRHFGALDVVPGQPGAGGDGRADLDTTHVLYSGTSLGGYLGSTVVALAPEVDGAFVHVAGSGFAELLFNSWVGALAVPDIVPKGAPVGETNLLLALSQSLWDRSDNGNYLDRIRGRGTPFFLVYGIDDRILPNVGSERMVALLGLPVVGRQIRPFPASVPVDHSADLPADGRGVVQIPTSDHAGPLLGLAAHGSFLEPMVGELFGHWLDDRLTAFDA